MGKRLDYIDGMRGLLALRIASVHCLLVFGTQNDFVVSDGWIGRLVRFLYEDVYRFPVSLEAFMVISGFGLMSMVLRQPDHQLRGGLKGFYLRRIQRIWPAYYAAIALTLGVIVLVPGMGSRSGGLWDAALPALDAEVIVSHLLFLHNWRSDLMFKLSPPFWNIAVAEQVAWLFPLLILPIWRRWGMPVMAITVSGLGVGLVAINHSFFGTAHTHYLMLFAFGVGAACICFSDGRWERWLRECMPWVVVRGAALVAGLICWQFRERTGIVGDAFELARYVAVACFFVSLLVPYTARVRAGDAVRGPLGWLSSRPLVWLGSFSYSIYLIHVPLLVMFSKVILALGFTGLGAQVVLHTVGYALAIAGCYLFSLVFERPLSVQMTMHQRSAAVG